MPLDLTGKDRMKQHKRLDWNEALTALAQTGLGNVERQPLLFLEAYLCENSRAAQSEAMSGIFGCTVTRKGVVLALFTNLAALSLKVWEVSP